MDLSPSSGKFQLNLDTTVSWGARWRIQDRDYSIISPFEGGTAWSVNGDDGNLNFGKGLVSNTAKATVDLDKAMRPLSGLTRRHFAMVGSAQAKAAAGARVTGAKRSATKAGAARKKAATTGKKKKVAARASRRRVVTVTVK